MLPEVVLFRNADPDTMEGKLWKLRSDIMDDFKGVAQLMARVPKPIMNLELVIFMRVAMIKAVAAWAFNVIGGLKSYDGMNALLSIDPSSRGLTNGIVMSKHLDIDVRNVIRTA